MASQENASVQSIRRSEELRRGVRNQVLQIERSVVLSKQQRAASAKRAGEVIKQQVQVRIKENVAAIKTAEKMMRSVDESVKETGLSVTRLTHEKYKQFAALQVCQRRIELRNEQPLDKPDGIQEALNMEQMVLIQSREEIEKMENEIKVVIEELKGTRAYLTKDAAHRRHEVELDRARLVNVALASTKAPGTRPVEDLEIPEHSVAASSSMSPVAAKDVALDRSMDNEQSVTVTVEEVEETRSVCMRSFQLRDKAESLRNDSQRLIKTVREKCSRATARVKERLARFNENATEITRQLIGQGKEVDWTIDMARRSLDAQKKNLNVCGKQQELEYRRAKDMLDELRRSRTDLSNDLRHKTKSLNISESCRKVTPQRAHPQRPFTAGATRTRRHAKQSNDKDLDQTLPSLANGDLTRSSPEIRTVQESAIAG